MTSCFVLGRRHVSGIGCLMSEVTSDCPDLEAVQEIFSREILSIMNPEDSFRETQSAFSIQEDEKIDVENKREYKDCLPCLIHAQLRINVDDIVLDPDEAQPENSTEAYPSADMKSIVCRRKASSGVRPGLSFNELAEVVLIPSRGELRGVSCDLWWSRNDFLLNQQETIR